MKRRRTGHASSGFASGLMKATTARTGEHCPLTGWWADELHHTEGATVFVAQGSLMPSIDGRATVFVLGPGPASRQ
jgi:hypothetical protein